SFADAGWLPARISIEPAPPLSVRSTTASAAALRLAVGRRIAMSISDSGRVDGERPAPTPGGELGHVLVGQPQRTRLGPAPRAGHLERAGAFLHGPDPLGVAQVPDGDPAHHLHHPGQRQLAAVDPVLDVGENTQDGVLGVADQGADLLIGCRDRGGAEPPVTHILRCRPRHDSALPPLLGLGYRGSLGGPRWLDAVLSRRVHVALVDVLLDAVLVIGDSDLDALAAHQRVALFPLAHLRHQLPPFSSGASIATNSSTSATTKPYSASASTATRLFSHRLVSWLLMVTVASVLMRYEMPPTAPQAALVQSPPNATVPSCATPWPMKLGRFSSRPGRARPCAMSSVGRSTYSGRPVASTAPHSSGSTTSSSAHPVSRLPSLTSRLMTSTRSAWIPPSACAAVPRVTDLLVSASASLNGPLPVPSPPMPYSAA